MSTADVVRDPRDQTFTLVQLSDPHLGATWGGGDPDGAWRAAIQSVRSLDVTPTAVLVTGDLADHATDDEYARLKATLASLNTPAYVLPGNQDHRDRLRKHFALAGKPGERVHYTVDLGPLRLVALDTSKPGADDGELGQDQLEWLESVLSTAQESTTVIAMHHPPFETGMPAWDSIGLSPADRSGLAEIVRRHAQACGIVAGHVHRLIVAEVGGIVALTAPSTYVQARLRFRATRLEFDPGAPGFLVHTLLGRELISTVHNVVSHGDRVT